MLTLVALSIAALVVDGISRKRRRRELRRLAAQWQMTYSPHDRLRVAEKIAHRLPVPGAADVFVTDVVYGGQGDLYRYVFTAEFTTGIVRAKRRQVRVGTFEEPRGRLRAEPPGPVTLAPEGLTVVEQYRRLGPGATA